jgi:transcriptional regulator with XRE-family HTH domain
MSFLSEAFGRVIKMRRKELKLSQAALAELSNSEGPTVSRWESGEFLPSNETTDKILKIIDLSAPEFLARMGSGTAETSSNAALIAAISALNNELESIPPDLRVAFGTATPAQVAEMTRAALAVLRAADPQLTLERAKARLSQIDSPDLKPNPKRQSKS